MLSMFAGFNFQWPPAVTGLYHAFSLVNFNFELLAPECSVSLNYEAKWYIVESLPVILLASVCVVIVATRTLQWGQRYFLGRLPFGALSTLNLIDVCIGIFISGLFMLYFGKEHQEVPLTLSNTGPHVFVLSCMRLVALKVRKIETERERREGGREGGRERREGGREGGRE